jgi:hypothetical protein
MNLIGTVINGRLIGWLVLAWALSLLLGLGGLWLYMDGSRSAAVTAAAGVAAAKVSEACALEKAQDAKASEQALLAAVRGAIKARAEAQAELDAQRDADEAALRSRLDRERQRADALSIRLRRHLDATPLPAGCRLDAERVRLFNALRRGSADPRADADRPGLPGLPGSDVSGAPRAAAGPGWHSERGWAAGAGWLGWRDAADLPGRAGAMPDLRAPGAVEGRDSLIAEAQ